MVMEGILALRISFQKWSLSAPALSRESLVGMNMACPTHLFYFCISFICHFIDILHEFVNNYLVLFDFRTLILIALCVSVWACLCMCLCMCTSQRSTWRSQVSHLATNLTYQTMNPRSSGLVASALIFWDILPRHHLSHFL